MRRRSLRDMRDRNRARAAQRAAQNDSQSYTKGDRTADTGKIQIYGADESVENAQWIGHTANQGDAVDVQRDRAGRAIATNRQKVAIAQYSPQTSALGHGNSSNNQGRHSHSRNCLGEMHGQIFRCRVEEFTTVAVCPILYTITTDSKIEFWVGGDRPNPVKILEIPRFGQIYPVNASKSGGFSAPGSDSSNASIPVGYNAVRSLGVDLICSAETAGIVIDFTFPNSDFTLLTAHLFALGFALVKLNCSAFAQVGGALSLNLNSSAGINEDARNLFDGQQLQDSSSDNFSLPANVVYPGSPELRTIDVTVGGGADASIYRARPPFNPQTFPQNMQAQYSASVSGNVQAVHSWRAYISAVPYGAVRVMIAWNAIATNETAVARYFELIGDELSELNQAASDDWRRASFTTQWIPINNPIRSVQDGQILEAYDLPDGIQVAVSEPDLGLIETLPCLSYPIPETASAAPIGYAPYTKIQ